METLVIMNIIYMDSHMHVGYVEQYARVIINYTSSVSPSYTRYVCHRSVRFRLVLLDWSYDRMTIRWSQNYVYNMYTQTYMHI